LADSVGAEVCDGLEIVVELENASVGVVPPLPPVAKLFTRDREGVPEVSSLKMTTKLELALFVLVRTKTLRSCGSAIASAVANNAAASIVPVRQKVHSGSVQNSL
jgi:hypothetical protein